MSPVYVFLFGCCFLVIVEGIRTFRTSQLRYKYSNMTFRSTKSNSRVVMTTFTLAGWVRSDDEPTLSAPISNCTCGVFLTDQFVRGSPVPPNSYPIVSKEIDDNQIMCNSSGDVRLCIKRCVESIAPFVPRSDDLICSTVNRPIFKEQAFLFVDVCNNGWFNTKFSTGHRRVCCYNNEYYKCPV